MYVETSASFSGSSPCLLGLWPSQAIYSQGKGQGLSLKVAHMASEGHLLQKARQRKHRDGLVAEKERAWGTWLSWGTIGRLFLSLFFFLSCRGTTYMLASVWIHLPSLFSVSGEPLLFCLLSQATPAQHAENWTLLQS